MRAKKCSVSTFGYCVPAPKVTPDTCKFCGEVMDQFAAPALSDSVPQGVGQASRDAFFAQMSRGKRGKDVRRIWEFVVEKGGATCDAAEVALGLPHQTASARFNDLERAGLLMRLQERRRTRTGSTAQVYVPRT